MRNKTIQECMTKDPQTIEHERNLATAHRFMRQHKIRHLPVLKNGSLVGVITQRDLFLVETLRGVDPEEVLVEEAMTPNPYTVSPSTPLAEAAKTMADHKHGCAIVVEGGEVVGLFTSTDALRILSELLEARPHRERRA